MSFLLSSTPPVRRLTLGLAAIGLVAVGGVAGATIGHGLRPPIEMAPTHSVAIRTLASSDGIVTIKGRVAERFGSRLVIDDGSGRTLVDLGPREADDATLAPLGSTVSVQGRFDREAFHPSFLVAASGTVTPIGPPHGPHDGPHEGPHEGPHGGPPGGPEGGPGPDGDADRAPPPPPPATAAPAATAPATTVAR
jgi:hypothetical protein